MKSPVGLLDGGFACPRLFICSSASCRKDAMRARGSATIQLFSGSVDRAWEAKSTDRRVANVIRCSMFRVLQRRPARSEVSEFFRVSRIGCVLWCGNISRSHFPPSPTICSSFWGSLLALRRSRHSSCARIGTTSRVRGDSSRARTPGCADALM